MAGPWLTLRHLDSPSSRLLVASAAFLVALVFAQQVWVGLAYAAALDPAGIYNPRFDPAIYRLAEEISEETADLVISADWGIHQGLLSLAPERQRPTYRDWWRIFMQPPGIEARRDRYLSFPSSAWERGRRSSASRCGEVKQSFAELDSQAELGNQIEQCAN